MTGQYQMHATTTEPAPTRFSVSRAPAPQTPWVLRILAGLLATLLISAPGFANDTPRQPILIKVGGYDFPPFVSHKTQNHLEAEGMTIDLLDILNRIQSDYFFDYFETTPRRRYQDFSDHRYDAIFFENPAWGWQGYPVQPSRIFLHGGEVYIALQKPGRDQGFFDDLKSRRLVGISGYHYGFADFNANHEELAKEFNILWSADHLRNIKLILIDRPQVAEVAVVTCAYLSSYFKQHPADESKILVSNKLDQTYEHRVLVREKGPISAAEINRLLNLLLTSGEMAKLASRYGIDRKNYVNMNQLTP